MKKQAKIKKTARGSGLSKGTSKKVGKTVSSKKASLKKASLKKAPLKKISPKKIPLQEGRAKTPSRRVPPKHMDEAPKAHGVAAASGLDISRVDISRVEGGVPPASLDMSPDHGSPVTGTNPCVCGDAPEEHGRDPEYPGSTACRACSDCIAYEADPGEGDPSVGNSCESELAEVPVTCEDDPGAPEEDPQEESTESDD